MEWESWSDWGKRNEPNGVAPRTRIDRSGTERSAKGWDGNDSVDGRGVLGWGRGVRLGRVLFRRDLLLGQSQGVLDFVPGLRAPLRWGNLWPVVRFTAGQGQQASGRD